MKVLVGGVVLPMHVRGARAEAIAFDRGRVVAVGRRDEVIAAAGPDAIQQDAKGATIVPGFVDAHHHLAAAWLFEPWIDVGPDVAPTVAALLARLRSEARELPGDAWVRARNVNEWGMRERRLPTRTELDDACGGRPVVVMHWSLHECVASTRAMELAGIGLGDRDPPGGRLGRDWRGRADGHLVEAAMWAVERAARVDAPTQEALARESLERRQAALFACGITRVADPLVPPDVERIYLTLRESGLLRMPVVMMPTSGEGMLAPPWDRLEHAPTGSGDDGLRVGSLKMWLDSGVRCAVCLSWGAALRSTLAVAAHSLRTRSLTPLRLFNASGARFERGRVRSGVQVLSHDDSKRIVARATERGFSVALHAIGNDAIDQAIDALSSVPHRQGAPPPRIEHGLLMSDDLVPRLRDAGICVVTQPAFLRWAVADATVVPSGLRYMPLRTLLDAGVVVAGSSDAPVATHDVLDGIRSATTRQRPCGSPLHPEEAVEAEEALAMWTREAARACGCLDVTGTIEPGKRADLVWLSRDPTAAGAELEGVRVLRTVLGGETVYASPPGIAAPP